MRGWVVAAWHILGMAGCKHDCKGFRKSENDLFNDTYPKLIFPSSYPTSVRNRVLGEGRHG